MVELILSTGEFDESVNTQEGILRSVSIPTWAADYVDWPYVKKLLVTQTGSNIQNSKRTYIRLGDDFIFKTNFMTYHELVARLRTDLKDPEFFGFDLSVPNNEMEYQEQLNEIRDAIARSRRCHNKH